MTVAARIISVLFHPLLMVTYLFLLLSYALPSALAPIPMEGHQSFILLIFIVTFLFPVINIGISRWMGLISSVGFYNRRDRVIPFTLITIFYGIITYFFYAKFRIGLQDSVLKLMIVLDVLVVVTTIATYFYKISVHSLCMWGLIGMILFLNKVSDNNLLLIPSGIMLLMTGVVMSARLKLNAHTSGEIWFGAMLGFVVSFLVMAFLF